ncbi:helix-turn-helix transcriptional regulator [Chamaesiphon polymorphus]|uniref:AraC family transcriptional regulator n=1 Tax=Chamaesiphon polymorphus CCALA 037 TaxID=2107692 RepID=A0A2T1GKX3_9CYAN|nr:AraC family transcriptional regulator [Chamaesiphon polymorphus]PSB58502.1 AraC family transcriptional regulator [Chamaesiphon polymorphus CCALA 037]
MKNPIIIDYNQEDASLNIFPDKPLLSSHKDGWSNIKLEYYQLPPHSTPEHLPAQNAILIFDRSIKVSRQLGDLVKFEHIKTGDIVVSPASFPHSASWDMHVSFMLLFLDRKFIANTAYEFIDPDRVELLPSFSQPDPVIYGIGSYLKSQLESGTQVSQIYIDSTALFLASHLLEHYCLRKHTIERTPESLSTNDLRQVDEYINANLHNNLSVGDLAGLVNMSPFRFSHLFKNSLKISPYKYLIECRLQRAASLLADKNLDIAFIAHRTGFASTSNFIQTFKKHFSLTPKQFRQK